MYGFLQKSPVSQMFQGFHKTFIRHASNVSNCTLYKNPVKVKTNPGSLYDFAVKFLTTFQKCYTKNTKITAVLQCNSNNIL